MPAEEAERPQTKPFAAFLQEARGGGLHGELSDGLAGIVAAVMEHGRKGSLTVKFTVERNKDGVTVMVTDDIVVKAPKAPAAPSLFYPDEHGNLSRRDPRQPELPLRGIPGAKPNTDDGEDPLAEAGAR